MTVRRVVPRAVLVLGFVVGGGSTADAQPGIGATGQRKGPPCIVDSVQARFTATGATYRSSGRCLYYMVTDAQGWRSNLVELPFTAEASVGYAGGVATPDVREVVLMTARDANTVARNDGSIRTTWRCSGGDQWRADSVLDCERTQTDVVNLDIREVERLFDENLDRRDVRPLSSRLTPDQRAALNADFPAFQAREAGIRQAPGAAESGVRRDGAAGGTARSAPPSVGTRTSAQSTAPTITAPRSNGLMALKKSRFVITPSRTSAGATSRSSSPGSTPRPVSPECFRGILPWFSSMDRAPTSRSRSSGAAPARGRCAPGSRSRSPATSARSCPSGTPCRIRRPRRWTRRPS